MAKFSLGESKNVLKNTGKIMFASRVKVLPRWGRTHRVIVEFNLILRLLGNFGSGRE